MPRGYPALHALAPMQLVVVTPVRCASNYLAVFHYNGSVGHHLVERVCASPVIGLLHKGVMRIHVLDDAAGGEVGVFDSSHIAEMYHVAHPAENSRQDVRRRTDMVHLGRAQAR